MSRLIIYCKDVQLITGRSERTAFRLIRAIKKSFNKTRHQCLSVAEFCKYMGLDPKDVMPIIR